MSEESDPVHGTTCSPNQRICDEGVSRLGGYWETEPGPDVGCGSSASAGLTDLQKEQWNVTPLSTGAAAKRAKQGIERGRSLSSRHLIIRLAVFPPLHDNRCLNPCCARHQKKKERKSMDATPRDVDWPTFPIGQLSRKGFSDGRCFGFVCIRRACWSWDFH